MTTDDQSSEPGAPAPEPQPPRRPAVAAAGESAAFAALRARVRRDLDPDGVVERRLADRVARLLRRLERLGRYETATAARSVAAANLPPDPDGVVGDEVELYRGGPPAGPAVRLAYARGWMRIREDQRPAAWAAARCLRVTTARVWTAGQASSET